MEFTKDTRLEEILNLPCFHPMNGQFVASAMDDWFRGKEKLTLEQLQEQNPTWYWGDAIYGLNRLQEIALGGVQYVFQISEGVSLIHLPANNRKYKEYAILNAGGAYGAVCTMVESLPVAARLNELGMDCFCLNYRTATKSSFLNGLMPQPMEDLAASWQFIQKRQQQFGVDAGNYLVGGFSAGGHLTAMWGTPNHGARSFGIPNPKGLLLAYPLIGLENAQGPAAQIIRAGMLGAAASSKKVLDYSASRHVDQEYPAVYLVQAMDDDTVPAKDAQDLEAALHNAGVPHHMERVASGGHGFGLGSSTPADGWVERAVNFLEGVENEK